MVGMAGGVVEKEAAARGKGRRVNEAATEAALASTRAREVKRRPSIVGGACVVVSLGVRWLVRSVTSKQHMCCAEEGDEARATGRF